jgi:hypothetical protein
MPAVLGSAPGCLAATRTPLLKRNIAANRRPEKLFGHGQADALTCSSGA